MYFDLLLESDLFLHCGTINRDTNGTNGFDNTALFTVVSDDDVFPETDCQLRAPDYLGIVAVRLNISHNDGFCLHPVLANISQDTTQSPSHIAELCGRNQFVPIVCSPATKIRVKLQVCPFLGSSFPK